MPVGIHDSRVTCTPETQKPQKVNPRPLRTPELQNPRSRIPLRFFGHPPPSVPSRRSSMQRKSKSKSECRGIYDTRLNLTIPYVTQRPECPISTDSNRSRSPGELGL